MREQDQVVNDLFQDFDSLTVPVSAFITFFDESSKLFALNYQGVKILLGQELRFKQATEPTNIIWENRHYTWKDYLWRQFLAYLIIFVLLLGSFLVVFLVAKESSRIANQYP